MVERHRNRLFVVSRAVQRAEPANWPTGVTVGLAFGLLLVVLVLNGIFRTDICSTVVFDGAPDAVEPNKIEAALPFLPYA